MSNRYRVSLNGNHLDAVDSKIFILDINYPEAGYNTSMDTPGNRHGGIVSRRYRGKTLVDIQICINAYSTAERNSIYQSVIKWAKDGGILVTNDRSNVSLRHAEFEKISALSAKNWTEAITIEFADYVFPFWEDDTETTKTLAAGNNSSGTIKIPGNALQTHLYGTITANASITWIKVHAGDTMLYLSDLSLSSNDVVTISYDDLNNLQIKKGNTSLLDKRTGDDELIVDVNKNQTIKVQANASVTGVLKGRGCWL